MKHLEPLAPRDWWALDPDLVFLNNGSFGAPPQRILELRAKYQLEMERNPLHGLAVEYVEKLTAAVPVMARFVGADADGFVFVPNATFGVNAVLSSMKFSRTGEIVVFPHRYPAVGNAASWFAARTGAKVVATPAPARLESSGQLVEAYAKAINARTELVIVDHISSLSGIVFPVSEIVALCRQHGVPVLVDGAHAPGQIELDVSSLGADFYTGNFHKWLYAPRPIAFLHVAPKWREKLHPPVISNYYGQGFREEFAWHGTFDPTPMYCVEEALQFWESLGGPALARRNHELAAYGGERLVEALGGRPYYEPRSAHFAAMFACPLPFDFGALAPKAAPALRQRFLKETGIEAHFAALDSRVWVRLSAQAFNGAADMDRLAEAAKRFDWKA